MAKYRGGVNLSDGKIPVHFIVLMVAGAVIFLLGAGLGWLGHQVPPATHALREAGYKYINPILLCNIDSSIAQNEDTNLDKALGDYISAAPSKDVGVYYLKPAVGKWAGFKENESFSPASMLKVPIMAAVMRNAELKPDLLAKKILYSGATDNNALEDIRPQNPILPGKLYSVDELLGAMIIDSDNNATQLLTDLLSEKEFENIYTDLGLEVPSSTGPVDFMSPKTFTLFLRVLYNGTYLSREHSEQALDLMAKSSFSQGLRAGIPADVIVSSKFGERRVDAAENNPALELHDCGIVYAKTGSYFLCVMTRGNDFTTLAKEIADISKLVYEHQ